VGKYGINRIKKNAMSKLIIEEALKKAIDENNLYKTALKGGNEVQFTTKMSSYVIACFYEVGVPNHAKNEIIDLVKFKDRTRKIIRWAVEAKHYTPFQRGKLRINAPNNPRGVIGYLEYSLNGPISDILKLIDCGFKEFYIIQLQTQILPFTLKSGKSYQQLLTEFPLFGYISKKSKNNEVNARNKINKVINQNWIGELETYSRQVLDENLIYNNVSQVVTSSVADIDVLIHYLISGPFEYKELYPRLLNSANAHPLDPVKPFENQVGLKSPIKTWQIDVSIASDPKR